MLFEDEDVSRVDMTIFRFPFILGQQGGYGGGYGGGRGGYGGRQQSG